MPGCVARCWRARRREEDRSLESLPGWRVAIANNTENGEEVTQMNPVQESRDMYSTILSMKPGDPGWLVNIAESLEEDRQQGKDKQVVGNSRAGLEKMMMSRQSQEKDKLSQDSGKGRSTTNTQTSRISTSQTSSQSSASSMFDLLGSQEVASQVILYQEKVVRDSQESADREDILQTN